MNYRYLFIFLAFVFIPKLNAQTPVPAKTQQKPIVLLGGTAHIGNGKIIENAVIVFDKGKITMVASANDFKADVDYEIIKTDGKDIYPGLIAPNTNLGLIEIGSVKATDDTRESGNLNPNVRSIVAYNSDSEVIPVVRSNGILLAQIIPDGNFVNGLSSIVQLDAWSWQDAAYKTDIGIHLQWPSRKLRSYAFFFSEDADISGKNENYDKTIELIETLFTDAKAYLLEKNHQTKNLKLEAMAGLFDGSKKLFLHVSEQKETIESILFAKKFGVKEIVLVGADEDTWKLKDFIKENNISVILAPVMRMSKRKDLDVKGPYKLPALFFKEGIMCCLQFAGNMGLPNLAFAAGSVVPFGLTKEEALMLITSNSSKILGIDSKTGTLETGKDANIIVSEGDILDIKSNHIIYAFIQGRKIDLNNKHKRMYDKFKQKYQ